MVVAGCCICLYLKSKIVHEPWRGTCNEIEIECNQIMKEYFHQPIFKNVDIYMKRRVKSNAFSRGEEKKKKKIVMC